MVTTDKLYAVMKFMRKYRRENGACPSLREICVATGIKSTASVHDYIEQLIALGYVERTAGKHRAFKLTKKKLKNLLENA